ncbi:Pyrroline-5-carboxylate reductase (EC [uncultured Gammaproteobacteria bacterium]|nr:Pyrroline-5-carboxylate reductase (EC [uncultured Gammaproteobacteria bacterium]
MQKTTTIGFIGAGNMAYALISGLINNGLEASNIKLSDTDTTLLSQRELEFGLKFLPTTHKWLCNAMRLYWQ